MTFSGLSNWPCEDDIEEFAGFAKKLYAGGLSVELVDVIGED